MTALAQAPPQRRPAALVVATRHLAALGHPCAIEGRTLRTGPVVSTVDWAGPVTVPMVDEGTVQAACGIMHVHGRRHGHPVALPLPYASTVTGVLAAQGVLAVLLARAAGRLVDSVATSVAQGALLAVGQYLAAASAADQDGAGWGYGPGGPPFRAADGVLFEIETLDASPWHRFWSALDAPEPDIRGGWSAFQQRFATATCPLPAGLAAAARRRLYRDVSAAAARCGVSVVPVRDDPAPPVAMAPWAISEQPGNRRRPEVPAGPGGPLAGLRVVEAGRRVQGPLAGHLLGALGAEVVRVEPPGGDPSRGVPPMAGGCSARFFALNRGKRVVEADLRSPGGRREVRELVAEADVFLHNWAPGRAAQIGLDATDLAAVRPDLVYACASGWSGALDPDPPIGTDFLVQAYSGVAAAAAPPGGRATPSLMTLTDVLGGLVCAEGVLAALVARARTGRGQRVDSSLLSAALVLLDTAGERAGPAAGGTWVREPLRTADGYLALAGDTDVEPGKLAAAFGAGVADDVPAQCRREPTATWLARLAGYGIAAAAVATDLGTLAEDSRFAAALDWDGCAVPAPPWRFTP